MMKKEWGAAKKIFVRTTTAVLAVAAFAWGGHEIIKYRAMKATEAAVPDANTREAFESIGAALAAMAFDGVPMKGVPTTDMSTVVSAPSIVDPKGRQVVMGVADRDSTAEKKFLKREKAETITQFKKELKAEKEIARFAKKKILPTLTGLADAPGSKFDFSCEIVVESDFSGAPILVIDANVPINNDPAFCQDSKNESAEPYSIVVYKGKKGKMQVIGRTGQKLFIDRGAMITQMFPFGKIRNSNNLLAMWTMSDDSGFERVRGAETVLANLADKLDERKNCLFDLRGDTYQKSKLKGTEAYEPGRSQQEKLKGRIADLSKQ
jgi:hypothetical protein